MPTKLDGGFGPMAHIGGVEAVLLQLIGYELSDLWAALNYQDPRHESVHINEKVPVGSILSEEKYSKEP